jgi:hypothetical protein
MRYVMLCAIVSFVAPLLAEDQLTSAAWLETTDQVDVLFEARSLKKLVDRAKPDFVWKQHDMLWIKPQRDGRIAFVFHRAATVDSNPTNKHWVVARPKADVEYIGSIDCNYFYHEVKVPEHDAHEAFAEKPGIGAIYRIGWESEPSNGTGNYRAVRDVLLLRQINGKWKLLGEGAETSSSRNGMVDHTAEKADYRIQWLDDQANPVRIFATRTRTKYCPTDKDDSSVPKDLNTYLEGTLDLSSKQMRWGEHEYLIVAEGDSLWKIAEHYARWHAVTYYDDSPDRARAMTGIMCNAISQLNPKMKKRGHPEVGERLLVPTDKELEQAFAGSPTTRPLPRN